MDGNINPLFVSLVIWFCNFNEKNRGYLLRSYLVAWWRFKLPFHKLNNLLHTIQINLYEFKISFVSLLKLTLKLNKILTITLYSLGLNKLYTSNLHLVYIGVHTQLQHTQLICKKCRTVILN